MKVTIVHTNNKNQLLVSTKTMEKLMERFARDDSKLTITHFRESIPYLSNNYEGYKDLPKWMHIYPAAEFAKDENNNLKMKAFNGILLLKFGNITDVEGVEGIKRSVAILPSTLAAITGADGKTVIVLIKFQSENDSLPTSEADAEHLYRIAYQQIFPVYQAIIKASILVDSPKPSIEAGSTLSQEPSIHNSFMMTLDAKPYFNGKAVAMKIDSHTRSQSPAPSTDNQQQTISDFRAPEEGKKVDKNSIRENIVNMMQLLESRYDFRYNTVMKFVEYMPKEKGWYGYQPVEPRVQKRMTLEVQLADIRVSIKDVRNFLESDYIKNYNPIEEYLFQCYDKWDGKDHIRALARTVCLPPILTGQTGFTPGSWAWWTSGAAIHIANTATRWLRFSFPNRVTTRVLSVGDCYRRNCSGGIVTILFCRKSVRFIRRWHSLWSSISMSSTRFLHRCSRDF